MSDRDDRSTPTVRDALAGARTASGETLLELSERAPLLIVLLRHAGCPFCREALADIAEQRARIEGAGVTIALVYQWGEGEADWLFERAGVDDLTRVADPDRTLYRALEIPRGNPWQIFGPWVLVRVIATWFRGRRVGRVIGDVFQMPGTVLVRDGEVRRRHRYRSQASRPDYAGIACSLGPE